MKLYFPNKVIVIRNKLARSDHRFWKCWVWEGGGQTHPMYIDKQKCLNKKKINNTFSLILKILLCGGGGWLLSKTSIAMIISLFSLQYLYAPRKVVGRWQLHLIQFSIWIFKKNVCCEKEGAGHPSTPTPHNATCKYC